MAKKPVMVRPATKEDVPAIRQIMQEAFSFYAMKVGISSPGSVQALEETCADIEKQLEEKIILVAEVEGVVAGSVRLEVMADGSVYFSRFGVLNVFKGKKIGDRLMAAVDDYMEDNGFDRLILHTAACLLSLIRFYYSKGFVIVSSDAPRGYTRALLCKHYENTQSQYAVGGSW
ncbi:GNAT family N-acetyltransferase [Acidaminobacter hydrogenoformans]|uniref:L-amino acid N-acyltransferase YncA n=1 Tax=Acidaminobacter hydrogenoformans DSM 2784 TaxID=1120920 RepID=A0A1G5S096_9FIRM|nr:GNAT family N-acetyltransferase [Acidaminobacter hydrogenoformans]SCZ79683.1 L-amino acid N-acyltransferase YncA [Acidaminobacter hydrogenoformans DSM 2784]